MCQQSNQRRYTPIEANYIVDFNNRDGISGGLADMLRTDSQQFIAPAGVARLEATYITCLEDANQTYFQLTKANFM